MLLASHPAYGGCIARFTQILFQAITLVSFSVKMKSKGGKICPFEKIAKKKLKQTVYKIKILK